MIQLLGDRVLVALPPPDLTTDAATGFTVEGLQDTDSGLVTARPGDAHSPERQSRGIVLQVGVKSGTVRLDAVRTILTEAEGTIIPAVLKKLAALGPAPFDVEVGDFVIFSPAAGELIDLEGVSYVILRESDIIGAWEPELALVP